MDLLKDEYIILEIIPTAIHPSKGDIIQLSALKLKGIQLQDRFDERLEERLIALDDFKDLISYDKEAFKYKEKSHKHSRRKLSRRLVLGQWGEEERGVHKDFTALVSLKLSPPGPGEQALLLGRRQRS